MTATRSRPSWFRSFWCCLACFSLGLASTSAQGLKLNGPLARPIGGDIRSAELSGDGAHLVYVADQDKDERFDLYSVDTRAASPIPIQLNAPRDFADVQKAFVITPDGTRVVYRADQDTNGVQELFVVPIDGSAPPRKLTGPLVANGRVDQRFQVSPNAKRVLYLAQQESKLLELFSTSLDGSTPTIKLNGPLPVGYSLKSFAMTADSRRVVFLAPRRQGQSIVHDLYGSAADGRGGPVLLIANASEMYTLSADSKRVFAVGRSATGLPEIQAVSVLGGTPLPLAGFPLNAILQELELAAKDTRVVLSAGSGVVYSVPSDGSGPRIQLASGVIPGYVWVSPDGRRVLYVSAAGVLFSRPADGSEPAVRLSPAMVTGGHVEPGPFENGIEMTRDGSRVAYLADQDVDGTFELFSVPIAGGESIRLNPALPASRDVADFDLTPDSRRAVYVADQDADELFELFVVPLDGRSAPSRVSAPLGPEGDVALRSDQDWDDLLDPLRITPDGARVIYLADQETPEAIELFRAPLDGSQVTARMNETLAVGPVRGDVLDFEFAPGGRRIVYLADQDEDHVIELYSVPTNGRERAVKLNGDLVAGGDVQPGFQYLYKNISPDGSRVVYLADQDTNDVVELFSVPIDGSAPPVKLNGTLGISGDVTAFNIDPLSRRVTFRADLAADERFELFSAPIDGSAPAVRLSATMVPGGELNSYQISADGARVVDLADQEVVEWYELYSVPIDGSAAPVKLNGALAAGGVGYYYALGPDSRWVAYSAAQEASDREDVYVVPIDGSAPPVRISSSAAGTDAREVLFSPDGSRVVFAVRQSASPGALLVAPRDGSQPPLQLSAGEYVAGGFTRIQFSADGHRLLYIASVRGNYGLFGVPVDGSSPSVQLSASGQYVTNDYLGPFLVSPAGRVVYQAGLFAPYSILSVPIDGSAAAVLLDSVSPRDSVITADGRSMIYIRGGVLARVPIDGSSLPEIVVRGDPRNVGDFEVSPDGDRIAFLLGVDPYLQSGPDVAVELFLRPLDLAPRSVDQPRRTPERP